MPSQVPSFSSFELPTTIESEASSSKHDKKRRRHRPEEEEQPRRHRHRSAYDDEADSGRSHRRRNETDSIEERRRDTDSRRGDRQKRTSATGELGREGRDERHRSQHRREYAEVNPSPKAIDHRSRDTITADPNKAPHAYSTSHPEVNESQRLHCTSSRARYDFADDTLPAKSRGEPQSSEWSLSLIKAVTQDWTAGSYDPRGDGIASRYGGPEASQIPRYKRVGKGAILGLPLHLHIVATTNSGIEVGNSRRHSAQTYDAQVWLQTLRPALRRIMPSPGDPTFGGGQEDYVRLEAVARGSSSSNARTADPFQIATGRVSSEELTGSSGSDTEDEKTRYSVEEAALKVRLREADQRTRSHPTEVRAWLALSDLQQQTIGGGSYRQGQSSRERGSAARKTIAEVQLSVLDKGQRAHAENAASITLGLARLQVAIFGSLWDDVKVESEFRRLLDSKWDGHTGNGLRQAQAVCAQYLAWKPTSASLTLTDVSNSYAEALRFIATFGTANAIDFCFSLQLRLCELLQRAGYSARAFAILQAQLELTLVPSSSGEDAKDQLERHWDCEGPRIGEQGAVLQAGKVSEKPTERACTASPSTSRQGQRNRGSPLDRWVATQEDLAHLRRRPARTDDPPIYSAGEGEVDPFSVVLFSDVRPFLISGLPAANRLLALRNFARYFGLDIDGRANPSGVTGCPVLQHIVTQEWSARFWPSSLQQEWQKELRPRNDDVEMEANQQPRLSDPWACPLFSTTRPLNSLAFSRTGVGPPLATADVKWLRLMLGQLAISTDEEQGAISAFRLAVATKTGDASILDDPVRKPADGDDCADLARARVFALNESRLSLSPELQLGVVDVVEYYIGLGQPDVALPILEKAVSNGHRYVSGDETLPVAVAQKLKARRYYSNVSEGVDEDASPASLAALVSAAWYHYLVQPPERRLASTLKFFDSVVESVPSDRTHHLCEARLRIIWYHLSQERPIYPPADVRKALIQSIRLFPHDLTFLALLAAQESRFKIEGVVRRTLEEYVLQPLEQAADSRLLSLASVVEDQEGEALFRVERLAESSWLMAIYIELHLNGEVVNSHLVRSLFERAVQQEATKTSSVLWTLYLSFEVRTASKALANLQRDKQQGRDRRDRDHSRHHDPRDAKPRARVISLRTQQKLFARAKAVFYRALSACPFDRDTYLQAYEYPFRLGFSAEELRQLFSVMDDERELRVFGRIEGPLQQMEEAERGGKRAGESDVDAETDDEEEESDVNRVQV